MHTLDDVKRVIQISSDLSQKGQDAAALRLLDESIAEVLKCNNRHWMRILSRHASVIADRLGDLTLVRHYREQTLTYSEDDPVALYGLADILFRQGETDKAKQYAASAYELCVRRSGEHDKSLLDLIAKRWPEIWSGRR
jgi:hypothetical protein